jgi:hypothetical protein
MINIIFMVYEILVGFARQSNRSQMPNFFSVQNKLTMKPKRMKVLTILLLTGWPVKMPVNIPIKMTM